MIEDFNSINDLYDRVRPALEIRVNELSKVNNHQITDIDIWNFLSEKKWKESNNLMLSDIVNDILNDELNDIDLFIQEKSQYSNE